MNTSEAFQALQWPSVEQCVLEMKIKVLQGIKDGDYKAADIESFSDLHDYMDANMLCEDILPTLDEEVADDFWDDYFEKAHDILQDAQYVVNAWITRGGLK